MKEKEKKKLGDRKDFSFFICVWLGVRGQKMKKKNKKLDDRKNFSFFYLYLVRSEKMKGPKK